MMTPSLNPLINLILKKLTPNPNSISTDIDVVLIAKFADFMSRALECFTTPILQSENLQRIITFFGNSLSQVREFNCNKQIFHFFTYFCNLKGSGQEQIILSYVSFISYHALLSTASISRNLYSSVIYYIIYIYIYIECISNKCSITSKRGRDNERNNRGIQMSNIRRYKADN